MEAKKSFIGYCDWLPIFKNLEKEEAGVLIMLILKFVNGLNPEPPDKIIKIAFEPIKLQLERDSKKWVEIVEKRSKAGQASAAKRQQNVTKSTNGYTCQQVLTDNVNENININVIDNDINRKENLPPTKVIMNSIPIENLEEFMLSDEEWVETLSEQNHFSKEITYDWVKKYISKLKTENVKEKNRKDCFSHCSRWINTQKNGKNKQELNKSGVDPNDNSIYCG